MNINLENYPDEAYGDDIIANAWEGLTERLQSSKHNIFDEMKTNVAITDLGQGENILVVLIQRKTDATVDYYDSRRFTDADELDNAVKARPTSSTRLRIVYVYARATAYSKLTTVGQYTVKALSRNLRFPVTLCAGFFESMLYIQTFLTSFWHTRMVRT